MLLGCCLCFVCLEYLTDVSTLALSRHVQRAPATSDGSASDEGIERTLALQYVVPLDGPLSNLATVGGKGLSLISLVNSGFNVPGGYCITTAAYKSFVAEGGLQDKIDALAKPAVIDDGPSFAAAASGIRTMFDAQAPIGEQPSDIRDAIVHAYAAMGAASGVSDLPVAVRSSATAEDLPDLSFAGQQDSFLNVRGETALINAVRNCWASLWTDRAMIYRHEHGIGQKNVSMAVVVQAMVSADVAGVIFTANPASGERNELVVTGSFGLGESVVSGLVNPDTFILDAETFDLKAVSIGTKASQITSRNKGSKQMW